ncbi:ParB N-terminal domain-containing protein [Rhodobacteraceae bacterium N5(2021)]|uniref:ParB N-terminal domain-containing protein n=1 Tax=Gymnodinialimonas phycosphaerae TaxID=2841589 RepID=A0A975TZI8_9RHOB|nr:ParB N-terminal domain-containing protein [Gymnodinialimonas phycosphaerae]MBY4895373.1 ParB N-terminal domain-containing protein [Gymnodinialimonas phycosphaerae]
MAKRKRLSPAMIAGQGTDQALTGALDPISNPPIARVAGDAASHAAVQELADELTRARVEGRLVQDIALDQIDETHLTRDRIATDASDMAALEASIEARGQQMPIEVVDLRGSSEAVAHGTQAKRFGLISGWRRLAAIKRLADRDPDRFTTVRAVLRRPDTAAEAYLSMVEENELRVGLSYYERAQVAARASDMGVFEGSAEAVQNLFPTASKAKRSKINAFVRLFRVLDPVLTFPEAIPERLGLRLAKALDAGQGALLYKALSAVRAETAQEEQARIEKVLQANSGSKTPNRVVHASYPGGVELSQTRGGLKLSGPGVTAELQRDLETWLAARQKTAP